MAAAALGDGVVYEHRAHLELVAERESDGEVEVLVHRQPGLVLHASPDATPGDHAEADHHERGNKCRQHPRGSKAQRDELRHHTDTDALCIRHCGEHHVKCDEDERVGPELAVPCDESVLTHLVLNERQAGHEQASQDGEVGAHHGGENAQTTGDATGHAEVLEDHGQADGDGEAGAEARSECRPIAGTAAGLGLESMARGTGA